MAPIASGVHQGWGPSIGAKHRNCKSGQKKKKKEMFLNLLQGSRLLFCFYRMSGIGKTKHDRGGGA